MMVSGEPSYKSAPRGAVVVSTMATAALALGLSAAVHADDPRARLQRQTAALAAAEAREAERSRLARLRWASERRNSVAHARMADTMYASTPSAVAGELSCPVATEDDVRAVLRAWDAGASNALGPAAGGVDLDEARRRPGASPRSRFPNIAPEAAWRDAPNAGGSAWAVSSSRGGAPPPAAPNGETWPSSAMGADAVPDPHAVPALAALSTGAATTNPTPDAPAVPAVGDLDGDGRDDVLLRHDDGRWRYYAMNGRQHVAARSGMVDLPVDAAWRLAGLGDLNGDGKHDALLRHVHTQRWRYVPLDGRQALSGGGGVALSSNEDWRVAGVGDLDGDGRDDVLLRHADTHRWYFYPMDGRRVLGGKGGVPLTTNAAWRVAGLGDLNGDGRDDVLLRHRDNHRWHYYPLDGRTVLDGKGGAGLTTTAAWRFAAIGDYDGDGREDVLLRHANTRRWYFYPMDGRKIRPGRGAAGLTANAAYALAGVGDLNGDGKEDVLLRHVDNGRWYYSPMNGRKLASGRGAANLTADRAWRMAGVPGADPTYRDCPSCPRMVDVPAGSFNMGSPAGEALRGSDEGPRRRVTFARPFAIGVREVTHDEWAACVADGGCGGHSPSDYGFGAGERPVGDVTWSQARAYAAWLAEETGAPYRLPTEAEWEYAARAGTTRPFHTGATISTSQANYDGTRPAYGNGRAGEDRAKTVPVGSFPANAFGLRDAHGNVAEWVADCHAENYRGAPTDGSGVEASDCAARVVRGGSWRDGPEELRSANRTARAPGQPGDTVGFRVARDLAPATAPDAPAGETAAAVFEASVSPIVQSKCVNCHVEGGPSGNTRLVFVRASSAGHLATNLKVFEDFLEQVDGGAALILNKVQGVSHGGGVQAAAGTDEYASIERFLGLLAGGASGGSSVTPETLFSGVGLEPARSTLRRAAIVFAGRAPTEAEYASIRTGGSASLRKAVRGLMTGPVFHEFLIRGANDRLLTDRDERVVSSFDGFVDYTNKRYELAEAAGDRNARTLYTDWENPVQYGARRAPLELITRVAERDLPYTQILTANYVMANPWAAEAYGASTTFDDPYDPHEFRPTDILSYYRRCEGQVRDDDNMLGPRYSDPGPCATDYPHAGVLSTKAFLQRYPTTATNRNRARSRWAYYHFLGLDVEKSASRTTDPVALADTNNPTMHNSACAVCHQVLDPVSGAFQDFGDEGLYRDQWQGLDAIDWFYKYGTEDEFPWAAGRGSFEIAGRKREDRQSISASGWLGARTERIRIQPRFDPPREEGEDDVYWHMGIDHVAVRNAAGRVVERIDPQALATEDRCGRDEPRVDEASGEEFYETWFCRQDVLVDIPDEGFHEVEVVLWETRHGSSVTNERRRFVDVSLGGYQRGDTWYRDMRTPGFDGALAPNADNSLQWLANRIVADPRFAEATVKFWWPALMGAEVAEPPAEGDADFDGRLLASNAQVAEVARLARSFRNGFRGGKAYNLKDLLTEMALSRWFRADALAGTDPARTTALANAGAGRLLTPEELSRKTVALVGFDWRRRRGDAWRRPGEPANWTHPGWRYGLLYGGIDSDGVTERSRDLTSVMAGVAQRHAAAVSCPVVMKEWYLLEGEDRALFGGLDLWTTPTLEFRAVREVSASSWGEREKVVVQTELPEGAVTLTLAFPNHDRDDDAARRLRLDRLDVRGPAGDIVATRELEDEEALSDCNYPVNDHFALHCYGALDVSVTIPAAGSYDIEVIAWADQFGDELAKLEILVGSDPSSSVGSRAIKAKLADLLPGFLGVEADSGSEDLRAAYDLFVDVWKRGRKSGEDGDFRRSGRCQWYEDSHYLDGIADHLWQTELDEWGNEKGWDWDAANDFIWRDTDMPDPHHVARTWVVVLAYLMTDPRYLHL